MSASKTLSVTLAVITAAMCGFANTSFGAGSSSTAIIIPARYRTVALAQDLGKLRNITVVSFQEKMSAGKLLMHEWKNRAWARISADELAGMSSISEVIVVGDDSTIPPAIWDATKNMGELWRVQTLNAGELVDRLSKILKLKPRELEWLAPRHGLTLVDKNAERRRYGKYGKTGKATPTPPAESAMEEADSTVMPPAQEVPESVESPTEPVAETAPVMTPAPEPEPAMPDEPVIPEEPRLEPVQDQEKMAVEKGMIEKGMTP